MSEELKRERDTYLANLTTTQARCTELLEEVRALRKILDAPPHEAQALADISYERRRQDAKWGVDWAKLTELANGTGSDAQREDCIEARATCDERFAAGAGSFALILLEEVSEALAESDDAALRAELVQAAAVCVKWIEAIDRRSE